MPSSVIVIPAYKPSEGLIGLIRDLRASSDCPIVIIDDGSGASFSSLFKTVADFPGVTLLRNAVNIGKGAALKHGFNHALLAFPDASRFVTADADGQHLPSDILAVMSAPGVDTMIMGARTFGADVPFRSKFGNTVSKYVYRLLTGIYLQDTQTGLRSIPRRLAEICLSIRSNRYEFETEQIITAKSHGFRFSEVPIRTVYIDDNASSHFNPLLDSFRIYFVLLRFAMSSIVTATTGFIVFAILITNGVSVLGATMSSRAVGLWIQFALLRKYVFKHGAGMRIFIAFVGYTFFTGYVSSIMQIQFYDHFVASRLLAKLVVEALIFVFNFLFLRDIIFRRPSGAAES